MKRFGSYILIAIFLFVLGRSQAQDVRFVTPTKYSQKDGLSSYFTTRIIKDSYGFFWIGTQEGLNLFDGNSFQIFSKQSPLKQRTGGSLVTDLVEDKKRGWIWVSFSYGEICAVDMKTRTIVHRVSIDATNPGQIRWNRCLGINGDTLWIGGLNFISGYSIPNRKVLQLEKGIKAAFGNNDFNASAIFFDRFKHMLILLDGYGIVAVDKNFSHLYTIPRSSILKKSSLKNFRFWDAVTYKDKLYTGGSWGVTIFNIRSDGLEQTFPINGATIDQETLSIAPSSDSTFLFSTHNGIFEQNLSSNKRISYKDVNKDDNLLTTTYDIFFDHVTQQAWLGTLSGIGIFRIGADHFKAISGLSGNRKMHIFSVLPVADNIIYAGDENGTYHIDVRKNEISHIDTTGSTLMLFQDNHNNIFASNKRGLQIIKEGKLIPAHTVFPTLRVLDSDHLNSVLQYDDSLVVFGSMIQKGLTVWNSTSGKVDIYHDNSSTHPVEDLTVINFLYKAKSGPLMILTEKGIIEFNPLNGRYANHIIKIKNTNKIISNLMDMCETEDRFWIATYGDGIIETDKKFNVIKILDAEAGLNNSCVYRVFPYGNNLLLGTTNNGLVQIQLDPFKVKNYFQADGLHSDAFEQLCGFQDENRIIAGGLDGFTIINPAALPNNLTPPTLFFKKITIKTSSGESDTSHIEINSIKIPTNALQTTISFSALNYTNPKAVDYTYKINELNDSWINLESQNFVDLIGLAPGKYTLEVRASNEDGIWSPEPLSLQLIYLPKWYQTDLFKIFVLVFVALFTYSLFRFRINQIKEQQKIRREIGNDLHDDIGSTLNTIKVFTHLAIREPENKSHLSQIEKSISQATIDLRDMLWVLDDKDDTIYEVVDRIKKFALPTCVSQNILFDFKVDTDKGNPTVSKKEKRDLFLIAKEVINNSLKYSGCRKINLNLRWNKHRLVLTIRDDGKGFDISTATNGRGLKNMQYRAHQIGFKIKINSSVEGTVTELSKNT